MYMCVLVFAHEFDAGFGGMMQTISSGKLLVGVAVLLSGMVALAQDAAQADSSLLGKEDARLNAAYKRRVAQLESDPAGLAALRKDERSWIVQRDTQCGKDVACLTQDTKARADYFETQVKGNDPATKASAPISAEILGKWKVQKVLPTDTISCWDQKQADALIGTELEYKPDSLRWKTTTVKNLGATTTTVDAQQFMTDNSGSSSVVTFKMLGIAVPKVKQVAIEHAEVTIQDGSPNGSLEMPGDAVMLNGADSLVFSVCSVWFEARRER
jgi:Lysozyme inhibitor LprI